MELIKRFARLKRIEARLHARKAKITSEIAKIEDVVIDEMNKLELKRVTINNIGTVYIRRQVWAYTIGKDDGGPAKTIQILSGTEYDSLIKEVVNVQTASAVIREFDPGDGTALEDWDIPATLTDAFNVAEKFKPILLK